MLSTNTFSRDMWLRVIGTAAFLFVIDLDCTAWAIDPQEQCQLDAHNVSFDLAALPPKAKVIARHYQGHYNRQRNECLLLNEETQTLGDNAYWTTVILGNVNGKGVYAVYVETPDKLLQCELTPNDNVKTICKSREEFDKFISEYMEK